MSEFSQLLNWETKICSRRAQRRIARSGRHLFAHSERMGELGDLKNLLLQRASELFLAQFNNPKKVCIAAGVRKCAWEHGNLALRAPLRLLRMVDLDKTPGIG